LLEQALVIDPDYAAAWAGLAYNYSYQARNDLRPVDEGFLLAREAANRALVIDPEYARAYHRLGRIADVYDGDLATAAQYYERALALDPEFMGDAATLAFNLGRLDEAIAIVEYTVARDPVNPTIHQGLGFTYLESGRPDEAIASFHTALSLAPGQLGTHLGIGLAQLEKGELEAALESIRQEPFEAYRLMGLALAYHALGQAAESDAALAEFIKQHEQSMAYNIAAVLAFRGENDHALEWLDKAVQYNDPSLAFVVSDHLLANIHDDPRWFPFLESIGKSPEQLAAIEFEVQLPE
jgi:tetratricopeptide (TPR) repeat protein